MLQRGVGHAGALAVDIGRPTTGVSVVASSRVASANVADNGSEARERRRARAITSSRGTNFLAAIVQAATSSSAARLVVPARDSAVRCAAWLYVACWCGKHVGVA